MFDLARTSAKVYNNVLTAARGRLPPVAVPRSFLLADENRPGGGLTDAMIANVVSVGKATPEHVRKRFVLEGMEAAIERKDQGIANRVFWMVRVKRS